MRYRKETGKGEIDEEKIKYLKERKKKSREECAAI